MDFYSLLGFQVSTQFRAGPAKAAWLEQQPGITGCRLELIEVPEYVLQEPEGMKRRAVDLMAQQQLLGHNHMALDVTAQIQQQQQSSNHNLTTWLEALNQTSLQRWNRTLRIALPPQQQMIGQGVYELAFLYDADGALVELLHKQTQLEQTVDSGWQPWEEGTSSLLNQ
ncbi:glyoxalase bleomycin resistance protein dioxygenase [Seminavis robusta]|uniref:Glyoxalase bleomycin resistance protein dioxygenase n=1 Tax=Seminavis robusta TaxID=568900 RepID=A0A9N8E7D3_9STRA|nr:glyoxalase bleomycin resistance protein dioxygenase [Seminavis robusta]|eukprot:Sro623_g177100.1 glyoxalase bleomycin resistance protein dioxygenase (169) ;mRNA; r:11621-12127